MSVLRLLSLPMEVSREADALQALVDFAATEGLSPEELELYARRDSLTWAETQIVPVLLMRVAEVVMRFVPEILQSWSAQAYFNTYDRLRTQTNDKPPLSHLSSVGLLSRASLIAHLLTQERYSCSQVARTLAATETSLDVPFQAISVVAKQLTIAPTLDPDEVTKVLYAADKAESQRLFPDSSLEETNQIATSALTEWLPEIGYESVLERLSLSADPHGLPNWPYFQMLHWCLIPLEYFDHPASHLYEFAPRGRIALDVFAHYPTATGNPILNNAKAVVSLNSTWARNRAADDAHALVTLLNMVESQPFAARRHVARVLRAWVLAVLELDTETFRRVSVPPDIDVVDALLQRVCERETNTYGVIEQRVVDALAVCAFEQDGWKSKGLGDGVNASNFSRRKLGDVEFTNVKSREVIALEAHGGMLTRAYIDAHRKSLSRLIQQRIDDVWSNFEDSNSWRVRVLFVAHSQAGDLPVSDTIHGISVDYSYIDYGHLLALAVAETSSQERLNAFDMHVTSVLNMPNVRQSARDKFAALVEDVHQGSHNA